MIPIGEPEDKSEVKIALIHPGRTGAHTAFPMGLGYLAAVSRANGHEVWVKDMEIEPEGLERFLSERQPDVVGLTILTLPYPLSQQIIRRIRKTLPNTLIVIGGVHVSAVKEEALLDNPDADLAVLGEGETTFLEILEGKDYSEILGICYRKNGEVITNPPRPLIKNLDELPSPAWDLFPMLKYRATLPYGRTKYLVVLSTSRGCPYRCPYCSQPLGPIYRGLSAERVVQEIEQLVARYAIREFHFYDDVFTMSKKRTIALCDLLDEAKLRIKWSCNTRVDLVDPDMLHRLKKAGCYIIQFGVESGNQEILDTTGRGYTVDQVKSTFKACKEAGLRTSAFFVLGLPGETDQTIEESVALAKEIEADYTHWSLLNILPENEMKEIFEKRGAKVYPAPISALVWYSVEWNTKYLMFGEENFTYEELNQRLNMIVKAFYFNPRFILKQIIQIRSFYELGQLLKTAFKLLQGMFRKKKT